MIAPRPRVRRQSASALVQPRPAALGPGARARRNGDRDLRIDRTPLFNEDVEAQGDPEPVAAFKMAIRKADAIMVVTPEYNYGVPGVLKNAIDWASRPPGRGPLDGKLAAIIGASPGMVGSARAQQQLRQTFAFTNTLAMLQPEVLVSRAHQKFECQRTPRGRGHARIPSPVPGDVLRVGNAHAERSADSAIINRSRLSRRLQECDECSGSSAGT